MNLHLFLTVLNQIAVGALFLNLAPVTSDLVREFGATYAEVGLLTTAFIVGQAVTCMPAGFLSDRFGIKRMYLAPNVGILAVVVLLATAAGMGQLLVWRFFLGVLMGTQFVVGSSYLAFWSPPRKATLYQGVYGSGFNFGIMLSFFLAAPQAGWLGWRGVFLIPGVLCAVSTTLIAVLGKEPERTGERIAGPGSLRALPLKALTLLGVSMATAWATFIVLGAWLTEYLMAARQSVFWLSAVLTGINVGGSGIGRWLGGAITRPGFEKRDAVWFYALSAGTAAALLLPLPVSALLVMAFLVGTATSMGFGPTVRLTFQASGPRLQGTAVGYVLTVAMVIGSVTPSLFGWLVEATGSFRLGFLVVLALPLAGLLALVRFRPRADS